MVRLCSGREQSASAWRDPPGSVPPPIALETRQRSAGGIEGRIAEIVVVDANERTARRAADDRGDGGQRPILREEFVWPVEQRQRTRRNDPFLMVDQGAQAP